MEDMVNETKFTRVLGNSPKIKVLEFLIEGRGLDYSLSDIAEGAEIGRTTLFRIWSDLVALKMVKQTRTIGNAKLFRLNRENERVNKLIKLFDAIVIEPLGKEKVIA